MNFQFATRIVFPVMVVVFSIGLMFVPETAFGCPTCKDALHTNQLSLGFAISILFMISVPFLILTGWLTFLFNSQTGRVTQ